MDKVLTVGLLLSAAGTGAVAGALGGISKRVDIIGSSITKLKTQQQSAIKQLDREWVWGGDSVKKYANEVQKLDLSIKKLEARKASLVKLGAALDENNAQFAKARSRLMGAAGAAMTVAIPIKVAASFEDTLKQISISGDLYKTPGAELRLGEAIRRGSALGNQTQAAVAAGVSVLVDHGMAIEKAEGQAGLLARVATAYHGATEDMAKTSVGFEKLDVKDTALAFDALAKSAKLGAINMSAMTRLFPDLANMGASVGMRGNEAVATLSARAQISRRTAGSDDEAAGNLGSFITKLNSKYTQSAFKEMGVNIKGKMDAAAIKGLDPIEAGINEVFKYMSRKDPQAERQLRALARELNKIEDSEQRAAEFERRSEFLKGIGERFGLGEIFRDQGAVKYLMAESQNRGDLERITKEIRENAKGTIDADFNEQMKLATEQGKALKIAVADLGIEIGQHLLPPVTWVTSALVTGTKGLVEFSREHPRATQAIVLLGGAVLSLIAGLGAGGMVFAIWKRAAIFLDYFGINLKTLKTVGRLAASGLRLVGTAVLWLGRALMMNPIGLVITGIAVAAYLIYRYWGPIKRFFGNLWAGIKEFFSSGIGNITRTIIDWSPLGLFYKAFAAVAGYFGIELPSSFTEFGGMLIDGLVTGIRNKLIGARDTIVNFGGSIKGWFTSTLGIQSPSRVFMGYGLNIAEGAALGVARGTGRVQNAIDSMATIPPNGIAARARAGRGGDITMHYAPTINVSGSGSKEEFAAMLRQNVQEFEAMLERIMQQRDRRAFA